VVFFKVEDFDRFKVIFASGKKNRAEAGLKVECYENLEDRNGAVVIRTASSKEAFVAFISSAGQQERMINAGITEHPTVRFIKAV
jgi:hypothetical protein